MMLTPVVILHFLSAILGIALLVYESVNHSVFRGIRFFPRAVLALLVWILSYAFELAALRPETMLLFANIQFLAIGSVPVLLYFTMRQFLGRPKVRPYFLVLSAVIPLITAVLAFTDSSLGLLRNSVNTVLVQGLPQLDVDYGFWHDFIFVPFQYAFYLVVLVLLIGSAVRSSRVFRGRLIIYIAVILLPMIGGLFYVMNIPPFDVFNPVASLTMFSFVFFGISMVRHPVRDVIPVARYEVLNTLSEAVIVLDMRGRIVEYNQSASSLFPVLSDGALNTEASELFHDNPEMMSLCEGREDSDVRLILQTPAGRITCEGRSTPVLGMDGSLIGRLLTISENMKTEEDEEDSSIVVSRRQFLLQASGELEKSRQFKRSCHIAAIRIPGRHPGAAVSTVIETLSPVLSSWERMCYFGSGRFFLLLPETDRDSGFLRIREISRKLETTAPQIRLGLAGFDRPDDTGHGVTPDEICAAALRATVGSRRGGMGYEAIG